MELQAFGQRNATGRAGLESVLEGRFATKHYRVKQTNADWWLQIRVLVARTTLFDLFACVLREFEYKLKNILAMIAEKK